MERKSSEFEHAYTMWKKASKAFALCADDHEPNPALFGLSDWEAGQIRKRVDKELARTF